MMKLRGHISARESELSLACNMGESRGSEEYRERRNTPQNHNTAAMSLERAMTRLSLRPASICRECRRTFTSPAKPRQQQSAASAIAGMSTQISDCSLENGRIANHGPKKPSNRPAPRTPPSSPNTRLPQTPRPSPQCPLRMPLDSPTKPWPRSQSRTTARDWQRRPVTWRVVPTGKDSSSNRSDAGTWEMCMRLTT